MESRSKLVVLFSFSLAAGVVAYFLGRSFVRREVPVVSPSPPVSLDTEPSWSVSEPVVPASVEPAKVLATSYDLGYEKGYRAFLEQQGQVVPKASYTTSFDGELDDEQALKGYVDGYHKAGDNFYCRRAGHH